MGALIQMQNGIKKIKVTEKVFKSRLEEIITKTPFFEPNKGNLIKTPGGNYAYYFENEYKEPFMLDHLNNLWIWAGADINNHMNDWLVRTLEGEVYNFYLNSEGHFMQKLLGNEKDLKIIPNTNMGTIIGFQNYDVNDMHYRELPFDSFRLYKNQKNTEENFFSPSLLEEGTIKLKKTTSPNDFVTNKNDKTAIQNDINSILQDNTKSLNSKT